MPANTFPGVMTVPPAFKKALTKTVLVPKTVGLGLPGPTRTKKMNIDRTRTVNLLPTQRFAASPYKHFRERTSTFVLNPVQKFAGKK